MGIGIGISPIIGGATMGIPPPQVGHGQQPQPTDIGIGGAQVAHPA
jgi:hypothetical protein